MTESVIMNVKKDGFTYGESRNQPFIFWLQFMNFAVVSALCWICLKIYRWFMSLYEWMFPLRCNKFYNPVILVIGTNNELNKEIVYQLSCLFQAKVIELKDMNDNIILQNEVSEKESRILYVPIQERSQEAIVKLSNCIRRVFGEIDLLFISQNEEALPSGDTPHLFLNNLNKQLLMQFWLVMAFLPRMLERNNGHIISIALGRTSELTNTGIVRSVCEEILQTETNVKLKLVERNSFVENHLPSLPNDVLARLIIRSIWASSPFVLIPTIAQYLLIMPIIVLRSVLSPVFRILNISTGSRTK